MCTLMTIHKSKWSAKAERRIERDAMLNPDGMCLMLIDDYGAHSMFRTFDVQSVLNLLNTVSWTRMFLHCRYATQGRTSLENIHGWSSQGVFYMHNGSIQSPLAGLMPVDSQAIGEWLVSGMDHALGELRSEPYANVFLIDTNNWYYVVNRSKYGDLYTDGQGNFSTHRFGSVRRPVRRRSQTSHLLYVTDILSQDLDYGWGS